jgi:hypothetical protein
LQTAANLSVSETQRGRWGPCRTRAWADHRLQQLGFWRWVPPRFLCNAGEGDGFLVQNRSFGTGRNRPPRSPNKPKIAHQNSFSNSLYTQSIPEAPVLGIDSRFQIPGSNLATTIPICLLLNLSCIVSIDASLPNRAIYSAQSNALICPIKRFNLPNQVL